jgi:hypothetical protein
MVLISLSVVVIALMIAVLAIYLFTIGGLLNRTADNLGDCLQSVKMIHHQAKVIGPGVLHLNRTGKELAGAMPLLYGAAETLVAQSAPPSVGYLDVPEAPRVTHTPPQVSPTGIGYLDTDSQSRPSGSDRLDVPEAPVLVHAASQSPPSGLGYLDV